MSQESKLFAEGLDISEESQVLVYLAKFNAGLADTASGLLASGLRPGMAGYDGAHDVQSGGLEPAKAGLKSASRI